MIISFDLFLVLHCLLIPPHIQAGAEMPKNYSFSIIIFSSSLLFFAEFVLVGCGRGYLGFSFLLKEDPQGIYKPICNNSYNVIPFSTIL